MTVAPFAMVLAALFDLSRPAHYLHWHFFQMSVANVAVILMMIAVFVLAIVLPFPKRRREP
jgi:type IV secretory pathway component VirB8